MIFTVVVMLLLTACSNTTNEGKKLPAIDLSKMAGEDKNKNLEQYWVIAKRANPTYPNKAKQQDMTGGCVKMSYGISESGKPKDIKVLKSIPEGIFDNSAIKSLSKWRYLPAKSNVHRQEVFSITAQIDIWVPDTSERADQQRLRQECDNKS